jgi:paraquat-inducible protein B
MLTTETPLKLTVKKAASPLRSSWYIWLFPLFALMICVWLLFQYFHQRGPVIQIEFSDAAGMEAEKTMVKFRGVSIGKVKDISISEDTKEIIATVELKKDAENFAVEGSKFWLVSPKVNFQGISGLDTLFEGPYIAVQPGKPEAGVANNFKAQAVSDTTDTFENTSAYYLETSNAESVSAGDLITYRGVEVGSVKKVSFSKGSQLVHIQIQIQNRYTRLIRNNTVFSKKAGVQANLGLFNSEIKLNSMDTLLHGGIEFFTPDKAEAAAKALTHFKLSINAPKDADKWSPKIDL